MSIANTQSSPKFMCIESVMPSSHLILCCPLLLLPSFFSSIRVFPSESALHIRWPKYWSFSLSISPSNEFSGLISFGIDWFDVLEVQGTLKSLRQHHSSTVQKHQYMQSISCEMLGWMNHKLESRLPGEISTTSDMQMISL